MWASMVTLVGLPPFAGVFTFDKVFCFRDLRYGFWDRLLWLRRILFSGEWPLWDPYLAPSGPVVPTGRFRNPSWSVETMPWVLWAADGGAGRTNQS